MPWRGISAVLLSVLLTPLTCLADDTEFINKLLEAGWTPSVAANKQIDTMYRGTAPHPHVTFAYALVKMRQWKYDDALNVTKELLDDPRHGLSARRMQTWLLVSLKRYSEALVAMEELSGKLPDVAAMPEKEETRRQIVNEMGRLAGFLRGPAAGTISDFERDSRLRRIVLALSDAEREVFDAQSNEVLDDFNKRMAERDRIVTEGAREFEAERERRLKELDAERERLDVEQARLDEEQRALGNAAEEELTRLRANEEPLRNDLISLDTQAAFIRTELFNISAEISRLELRLEDEMDPNIRAAILRDIDRLNFHGRRYATDLTRLDILAGRVQAQLVDARRKLREADAKYGNAAKRLDARRRALQQQRENIERDEKRIKREKPDYDRAARTIEAHARSLNTFVPFAHEDERARLLELAAK